jgi:molybdopterin-guanine dinucleotide biosynthesis protein MobB
VQLPPIIGFIAPSGTGKTTLIEGVVRDLVRRGLRIGALKHDAHRLELDRPGKDTWRFRQAGAWRSVICGEGQVAMFSSVDVAPRVRPLVEAFFAEADLVVVEGFRGSGIPCVRVHRSDHVDPDWASDTPPIAWVSDVPIDSEVPVLPLDQPHVVADWLVATFLAQRTLPVTVPNAVLHDA